MYAFVNLRYPYYGKVKIFVEMYELSLFHENSAFMCQHVSTGAILVKVCIKSSKMHTATIERTMHGQFGAATFIGH